MTTPLKSEILHTKEELNTEVARLAREISRDYEGKCPLLLGILKGSFVFMADLIRLLEIPVEIDSAICSIFAPWRIAVNTATR